MGLRRHMMSGDAAVEDGRTDEKYTDEIRLFSDRLLARLEDSGMAKTELAAAKEAGDAAVAYVDALEQMGASPGVVKVAAEAGQRILEEKHPQAVAAGS